MGVTFEWDPRKASSNRTKHGVEFTEAISAFSDPLARIFVDEKHSADERREILIGHSASRRLLLVCFSETAEDQVRIISARCATKAERQDYEDNTTN